jgi:hypothetical protein
MVKNSMLNGALGAPQLGLLLGATLAGGVFTACSNERASFDQGARTKHAENDAAAQHASRDAAQHEPPSSDGGGAEGPAPSTSAPELPGVNTPDHSGATSELPAPSTSVVSTSTSVTPPPLSEPPPNDTSEPSPNNTAQPSPSNTSEPSTSATADTPSAPGAGGDSNAAEPHTSDAGPTDDDEAAEPGESTSVPNETEPDEPEPDETEAPCDEAECAEDADPTVLEHVPPKGAKGVEADQELELTFSEPMDQDSVASALTISGISASARTLSWDDAGRVLTIVPDQPLEYSKGVLVDSEARSYTVSLGIGARDLDGNRLAAPFTTSFTTLRDLEVRISPTKAGQLSTSAAANAVSPSLCNGDSELFVGWTGTNASKDTTYIFAQFDPGELGDASSIAEFKSATFFARHGTPTPNYYDMGSVSFDSVSFGPMDSSLISRSVRETQLLADSTDPYNPSADLGQEFLSSWEAGDALLYRLSPKNSAVDERAAFDCYGMFVEVAYLAP